MIGVVFGHHKNEKYAFDNLYKYKIDKSENYVEFKSALTNNQISLSVKSGNLLLGTWQGIYLFEHRLEPHKRKLIHHFIGD